MLTLNLDSANITCTTASLSRQILSTKLFIVHFAPYGSCRDQFLWRIQVFNLIIHKLTQTIPVQTAASDTRTHRKPIRSSAPLDMEFALFRMLNRCFNITHCNNLSQVRAWFIAKSLWLLLKPRAGGRAPRALWQGRGGTKGVPNLTEYLCYGI